MMTHHWQRKIGGKMLKMMQVKRRNEAGEEAGFPVLHCEGGSRDSGRYGLGWGEVLIY